MKNTNPSTSAVAIFACLALTALAGCGVDRSGSDAALAVGAVSETQSGALTSDVAHAIDVEEVRNYHLSIHG